MRGFLIKLLGGYTKEDINVKFGESLLDSNDALKHIEVDNSEIGQNLAMLRAAGVKYVVDENLPKIIINLSSDENNVLLKDTSFALLTLKAVDNSSNKSASQKTLTIEGLIDELKLSRLPKDTLIVIDGYEGGYDGLIDFEEINIVNNDSSRYYYGIYDESKGNNESIKALLLKSTRREH